MRGQPHGCWLRTTAHGASTVTFNALGTPFVAAADLARVGTELCILRSSVKAPPNRPNGLLFVNPAILFAMVDDPNQDAADAARRMRFPRAEIAHLY